MKHLSRFRPLGLRWLVIALLVVSVSAVWAQSGGGFDLTWNTVDGGGGASTGGSYELSGTSGQADAGVLSGGGYALSGGFWGGTSAANLLYLPLVRR